LAEKSFFYNFGDGWTACIDVKKSESAEMTRKAKKQSAGFCGYDWMVTDILCYQQIKGRRR
jgi:hypothetical protein